MSAFGGMEQSESLIGTKGGMCHEYKSKFIDFCISSYSSYFHPDLEKEENVNEERNKNYFTAL